MLSRRQALTSTAAAALVATGAAAEIADTRQPGDLSPEIAGLVAAYETAREDAEAYRRAHVAGMTFEQEQASPVVMRRWAALDDESFRHYHELVEARAVTAGDLVAKVRAMRRETEGFASTGQDEAVAMAEGIEGLIGMGRGAVIA